MNIGMQQALSTSMQQSQRLVMTPAMVQAIRLLQLNAMELEQEINQEIEENPFLELTEEEEDGTAEQSEKPAATQEGEAIDDQIERAPDAVTLEASTPAAEADAAPPDLLEKPDHSEDNDPEIDEYYQETYSDAAFATAERGGEERDADQFNSAGTTLCDHLLRQLQMTDLEGEARAIGEYLIGNLDENGYLRETLEEVAAHFGIAIAPVEEVLRVIQSLEPLGVGARDICECLLIQIRARPDPDPALLTLVENHFDDLAHRRTKIIARAMKIPERRVTELAQRVAELEPKPGRAVSNEIAQHITPDVTVAKIDGKYYIALNEGRSNHLHVSSYYRQKFHAVLAAKRRGQNDNGSEDDEFIRKKFNDAVVLIRNIERRRGTILKITQAIMERQSDFLEKGIEHLHPMTLRDIAEEVGMHEATISRVTSSKYVETPRGTFPLKYFFSSGLASDTGESQSSRAVRSRIRDLLDAEDPKKPLSDQRLADLLHAEGTRIARRTVTKYREQMKILPTNMRRQT